MVTRLLPTDTFSSIPWLLIHVSPLEIFTMLTPLTFFMRIVRSFSTCISLPSSRREISWPFSSLTLTSPRIVIVGDEGEADFFGGDDEEVDVVLVFLVDDSSSSSSLPLDRLANFSFTSL